ncbi:response regulator [Rubricoccus marinus]|uniref:Response regulatory domain-containing protein n=1 Tax=Rubricoccus marinus TaxID=716817 RepID=A0A259U1I2_9BACT|nr:response regulator transcription factor [Rubricoccus marinus]OZC03674.1 hypothetical protein BSZ36_12195 [Rubricoccus marinus]
MHPPLRVFVADDSQIIRGLIADLLLASDDLELVGEAADGVEAITRAQEVRPEVVVLDLQMPRMSGLQALRALQVRLPETKVVILTNHGDAVYRRTCMDAGATHFLDKSLDLDGIGDVLRQVARARA